MKLLSEPCGMDESILITNIQHFSLHDGPGIRTTVFLKGCNLHCAWCHNPETISPKGQVGFDARRCIGCGMCMAACPKSLHGIYKSRDMAQGAKPDKTRTNVRDEARGRKRKMPSDEMPRKTARALADGRHVFAREGCAACGKCVEICPSGALELYGKRVLLSDIVKKCMRDKENFPGFGGVTFSGGECLLQARQVYALAANLKAAGIHVCIDTALNLSWEIVEQMLPVTDLFLVDVKAGTEKTHLAYVGASHERICENLKRLTKVADCWIRIPVVHGVNDTETEVKAMSKILGGMGERLKKIQLLTYHTLGEPKYRCLGIEMERFEAPDEKRQEWMSQELGKIGVSVEWN